MAEVNYIVFLNIQSHPWGLHTINQSHEMFHSASIRLNLSAAILLMRIK